MNIARRVNNTNGTRLRSIAHLEEFPSATPQVAISSHDADDAGDNQRYEHISRALARQYNAFDVTRERIRQIEAKALRKLKHPSRSDKLRSFTDTL